MNFLQRFLNPTTAHVVDQFQKTVNQLNAVAERHHNKGVKHNMLSDKHDAIALAAHEESEKASKVAKKIAALLG